MGYFYDERSNSVISDEYSDESYAIQYRKSVTKYLLKKLGNKFKYWEVPLQPFNFDVAYYLEGLKDE